MKSFFTITLLSTLVGGALGVALAYVEVPGVKQRVRPKLPQEPASTEAVPTLPKAEVPEKVYNFGKIERGTSMSHKFKIRNLGELPLQIEVKSTTCKCTVGDLTKNNIGLNEETEVLLEWVAKTLPGPFRHGAVLSTNDPSQSRIELDVEGLVVESSSMRPSELIFGSVKTGDSAKAQMYLMVFLDEEVKVLDYEVVDESLAKRIDIQIQPAVQSDLPNPEAVGGLKIEATYQADNTVGPFRGWLHMTTNLKKAKQLTVFIAGNVKGDLAIFGPGWNAQTGVLRLGSFASSEGKSVRLNLAVSSEEAAETNWEVAEVDPPELKVTLQEPRTISDKLQHVPILVEVPAGTRPMVRVGEPVSSDAHILLRSNHAKIADMKMRVRFAVE